jgi:hypothetical protein
MAGMNGARILAIVVVAALVVGLVVLAGRGIPAGSTSVDSVIDDWLARMASSSGDRGWSSLSIEAQEDAYAGDRNGYLDDVTAVDWSQVAWAPAMGRIEDGAFYQGNVSLLSHPSTLPRFLVERGLAGAMCIDDLPFGISVMTSVGWFTSPRVTPVLAQAGSADECAIAFENHPGAMHRPFDLVGAAWGSPGPNQRIGVDDRTGLVLGVGPGRQNPPTRGPVTVALFEPREFAVAWHGTRCDSNTTLIVAGNASRVEIVIDRGVDKDCVATQVTYEVIVTLATDIPLDAIDADLRRADPGT